jgi:deazaflavin-dependent oxidoreductase (nitroreductase family)
LVATNADLEVARSVPVRQAGLAADQDGCMMRWYDDYLRWLYRGGRPNFFARLQNRASAIAFAAGIWPKRVAALEVRGRRSGRVISFPVVIADYENERYLVSMLGEEANWVRNVRAAGGDAVLRHGRREAVCLEEVPAEARSMILRRYLERAPGARPHIPIDRHAPPEEFERIAPGIPVFRIRTEPSGAPDD